MAEGRRTFHNADRKCMEGSRYLIKLAQICRDRADVSERGMSSDFRDRSTEAGRSEEALLIRANIINNRTVVSLLLQKAARDMEFKQHPKRAGVLNAEAERQEHKCIEMCGK